MALVIERTRRLVRGRARLRGEDAHGLKGDRVVRIQLGPYRREYAYVARGAKLGSIVEVETPFSGTVRRPVVGLGRRHFFGRLKRARVVG